MEKTPNFSDVKQRNKPSRLSVSEVMTLVITFHRSGYRDFKTYYIHFVCRYLTNETSDLHKRLLIKPSHLDTWLFWLK
uniref:hypothetical protein n=2 Tax=Candidatus Enterovibrio escicola TaxID=1927127 RepID=UPI001237A70D|nr:hypothetical protein [Candidatus Enterovibrio escacola]